MIRNVWPDWALPIRDILEKISSHPQVQIIQKRLPANLALEALVVFVVGLIVFLLMAGVWRLLSRGRRVRKQIQQLLVDHRYADAAELYLAEGHADRALELFVASDHYSRAAKLCEIKEKWEDAGEFYLKALMYDNAIACFERAGKVERAAQVLIRQENFYGAAKLYEKFNQFERAGDAYFKNQQYLMAASIYLKIPTYEKAGEMYAAELTLQVRSIRGTVTPNQWQEIRSLAQKGADCFLRAGLRNAAADLFLKSESWELAAQVFEEMGNWEDAGKTLKKGGLYEPAARLYERFDRHTEAHLARGEGFRKKGQVLEAAQAFTQAGDYLTAADLWLVCGDKNQAAICYKNGGDYGEAGGLFVLIENWHEAAQCYEKGSHFEEAAKYYGKVGNVTKQCQLLTQAEKYMAAGDLFVHEGLLDKAIQAYQEVPENSADFKSTASKLGQIFFDKGMLGVSLKKFQQAVQGETMSQKNLANFYKIGVIFERSNQLKDASMIYEQILASDYDYEDVATRLGKINLEISQNRSQSQGPGELFESTIVFSKPTIQEDLTPIGGISDSNQGRFELLQEVGRGGMGIVYKARDKILNREVALKYLPANFSQNELAVKNFQREAQSTAGLNHPGIVTVYDVGFDSRGNYIAMEFLEGTPIKDIVRRKGAIDIPDWFILGKQMADALHYAHQKRIVHRDIKTSNMMWLKGGKVKIMDFGLAKFLQEQKNQSTQISGTPYYMSPEQTLGKDLDFRTDLYSLGVSLYEMATGKVPFKDGDIGYHHVHTPTPDPLQENPALPSSVRDIIWKCMDKKPDYRYKTADELAKAIAQGYVAYRNTSVSK